MEGVVRGMTEARGSAWMGRRVFLTGHTGFKGSWLVQLLARAGAEIDGYSLAPPTAPSLFDAARIGDLMRRHVEADIRDADRLAEEVARSRPDVVFHLAAQPLVRRSHADPVETFSTNVTGTAHLLDAVRRAGRPCAVIVVTSDKCYEPRDDGAPHREDDRLGGRDPYSASKACAELVTASYRTSHFPVERLSEHGVRLATARAGNVIGGGDWAEDRIVTDLVAHLAEGRPVPVRNPAAIRPWQHVLDPLAGYLTLAEALIADRTGTFCRGWNFGPLPGGDVTVGGLVDAFIAAWGRGSWIDAHDPRAPVETAVLRLSIERALAELPWRPRFTPAEAIRRTADWYRAFGTDGIDARQACEADIEAHTTRGR